MQTARSPSEEVVILGPRQLAEAAAHRWDDCGGLEESNLIRLSLLRDLLQDYHREKSRCLSYGRKKEADEYRDWEKRLERLRTVSPLQGTLLEHLDGQVAERHRTRLIPDGLFSFMPPEKFERYDRVWERTLAAEGAVLGWCFWSIEFWIKLKALDGVHTALTYQLAPHGVVLFSESADPEAERKLESDPENWKSRWYAMLKPRYRTPDFQLDSVSGINTAIGKPEWRLLYSPKKR